MMRDRRAFFAVAPSLLAAITPLWQASTGTLAALLSDETQSVAAGGVGGVKGGDGGLYDRQCSIYLDKCLLRLLTNGFMKLVDCGEAVALLPAVLAKCAAYLGGVSQTSAGTSSPSPSPSSSLCPFLCPFSPPFSPFHVKTLPLSSCLL